ncbi:MAG: aminotransferase class V-fold PLP-dependent enzyme [Planctomycetes bacterium]|nr:aminotransferase class V-fold PLP-dependent enzyme [Planctomycetota bacterium]
MTTDASPKRIYLDNAATSFPKPEAVYEAVDRYNRQIGVAVGRSAYRQAVELHRVIDRCRTLAAQLLGAESPERIIFTFNATDGLNMAIHGLLRPGDHVVTSAVEHNSVLRPLRDEEERNGVEVTRVAADRSGCVDPDAVRQAVRPNTRLVALLHASNVTGTIQPVEEVAEIAHAVGAFFLVDAAQTAGHLPIDLQTLPADLLACAGHKGLLGPLGTGLLYVRPGLEDQLRSLRQGGTGSQSEDDRQPAHLPDKYESGNHNAPALCGLEAALSFLMDRTVAAIHEHELRLTRRLLEGLAAIPGVELYGPPAPDRPRVGVVSFTLEGFEPQDLATILDESFGIQARAGLHCAPGAHRAIGTFEQGGTVRFSTSVFTTDADIDAALAAVRSIAGCDERGA